MIVLVNINKRNIKGIGQSEYQKSVVVGIECAHGSTRMVAHPNPIVSTTMSGNWEVINQSITFNI